MKHEETYTSSLHTHVHFMVYEPEIVLRIKAVLFVHHDLGENMERYDHYGKWMANQGFVVIVSDFAGHGRSLIDFEQGYFGEGDAGEGLLSDMHHLQSVIIPRYQEALHYFIGVGLGASLIRLYATRYGDYFHGMILLNPSYNLHMSRSGTLRFKVEKALHGSRFRSMKRLTIVRKRFAKKLGSNQPLDFLSNDPNVINAYEQDTMDNFPYPVKGLLDVLKINKEANSDETFAKTPDYLSIFIGAGADDPVTKFGKDAQTIYDKYKEKGIRDLSMKIYDHRRHAMMQDKDRIEVYKDLLKWLNERCFY